MRDMLILVLLVACTLWSLKAPWVGVMAWTLVSLMSPHVNFGYAAASWPVASGIAVCTLLGLLATKERANPLALSPPKFLLAFVIWTCITLPFSMIFEPSYDLWVRSLKIYLMLFVTLALVDSRKKLDVFIWINVVAIGYYGVKGGMFTIATGGNYRVWGPGGFIEGNNEVALAVLSIVPLIRYLQTQLVRRWAIHLATFCMLMCVATSLGTQSRGALVGLAGMGAFFWLKSDKKVVGGVVILLIVMMGLPLMPDTWWDRMNTIKTYDEDDSALGRINAWGMAFNLAKDRLFGGGFMIWTGQIFQVYGPEPNRVHAAHSIYFQVMGEHGFIGLILFLCIGATTWWTARDLIRTSRQYPQFLWAGHLGAMVQVSMIAYATAGAFLSLAYFDLPYNVMVMAVVARRLVLAELAQGLPALPPSAAAPSSVQVKAKTVGAARTRLG